MKETPKNERNIKHCDSKFNLEKISHFFFEIYLGNCNIRRGIYNWQS